MGWFRFRGTLVHLAVFGGEFGSTTAVPPILYVPNRVRFDVQLALQMVHLADSGGSRRLTTDIVDWRGVEC